MTRSCLLILFSLFVTPTCGAADIVPIALTGSLLRPPNGEMWTELRIPTIDRQGSVAFRGFTVVDTSQGSENSAYRTSDNRLIAQVGDPAPGLPLGAKFDSLTNLKLSSMGRAAFMGHVTFPDNRTAAGIWAEKPDGSIRLAALEGVPLPGVPGGVALAPFDSHVADHWRNWSALPPFTVNGSGEVAFFNRLDWPDATLTSYGIWSEGGGQGLRAVAYTGMPVPQFRAGASFWNFEVRGGAIPINDQGMSTFIGWLQAPGMLDSESQGIFVDDPQRGLIVAAQTGRPAPGLGSGETFTGFLAPTLNNAGQMAFIGAFGEATFPTGQPRGVWSGVPGDFQPVAYAGQPAPGVDAVFTEFIFAEPSYPVINGRGHVAFPARIAGPGVDSSNDTGIWAQNAQGQLRLIVREGELPRAASEPHDFLDRQLSILMNSRGQVAFDAENAIWATDLHGALHRIIGNGDLLPFYSTINGDAELSRVVLARTSGSTSNEDGLGSSLNDRGELVFFAYSELNSQGIFLSRAVAVPEPPPFLLTIAAAVIPANALRRKRPLAYPARHR